MMKVVSVNVSPAKEVPYLGRTVTTGIFKEPVRGKVMVRRLNIDGDDQADRRVHGVGFDMAGGRKGIWKKRGRESFYHASQSIYGPIFWQAIRLWPHSIGNDSADLWGPGTK